MVEALLKSYKENVKKPLYKSVMDMVVRANKEKFVEVQDMCEALEELFKDKIEERVKIESEAASKEAARIGWERGKKSVNDLNIQLIKQNRFEDVVKASADKEYQDRLFEEFGL